jgi:hypothetical protein
LFSLIIYANKKYRINTKLLHENYTGVKPRDVHPILEEIWKSNDIIDEYVAENPDGFDSRDLAVIGDWKNHVTGFFAVVDHLRACSVFLSDKNAFGVTGISDSISQMFSSKSLPFTLMGTLIPFDGIVTFDTVFQDCDIALGADMKTSAMADYERYKAANAVISTAKDFIEAVRADSDNAQTGGNVRAYNFADGGKGNSTYTGAVSSAYGNNFGDDFDEDDFETSTEQYLNSLKKSALDASPKHKLMDMLKLHTSLELKAYAQTYRISKAYSMRKIQIANLMIEKLSNKSFMEDLFLFLNDGEIAFIETVTDAGELRVPCDEVTDLPLSLLRSLYVIDMYRDRDDFIFVVPDEVAEVYADLQKGRFPSLRKYYCNMDRFASAAVNLYGVMDYYNFSDMYNKWNRKKTNPDDVFWVLRRFVALGRCNYMLWDYCIVHEDFRDGEFDRVEDILEKHKNIPVRILASKRDFLRYADDEYYEFTNAHKVLLEFLKKNIPQANEIPTLPKLLLDRVHYMSLRNATVRKLLRFLKYDSFKLDLEKSNALLSLITDVRNNTRVRGNNGWTPTELAEKQMSGEFPCSGSTRITNT